MTVRTDILLNLGQGMMRYTLVLFFVALGLYKFTKVEAEAIHPFIINSPFFSWLDPLLGVQGTSNLIGVVEVIAGVLVALRFWKPQLSAIGSAICAFALLGTLSFLFTTPDLSPDLQGFLLKDLALLGIAVWTMGEALRAHSERLAAPTAA